MFHIDRLSEKPIYEQIIEQLKKLILLGLWDESTPLPSVRMLSKELSINPNTLQKAYAELEILGICYSEQGTGRFVSPGAIAILKGEQINRLEDIKKISSELAVAGVPLEQVLECIRNAYDETMKTGQEGDSDD